MDLTCFFRLNAVSRDTDLTRRFARSNACSFFAFRFGIRKASTAARVRSEGEGHKWAYVSVWLPPNQATSTHVVYDDHHIDLRPLF